jgi:hypothetical protein
MVEEHHGTDDFPPQADDSPVIPLSLRRNQAAGLTRARRPANLGPLQLQQP